MLKLKPILLSIAAVLLLWVAWFCLNGAVDMSNRRETSEVYRMATDSDFRVFQAALIAVGIAAGGASACLVSRIWKLLFKR